MIGFEAFVGIDYSGAETASSRLRGLQGYACEPGGAPAKWEHARRTHAGVPFNWTRRELAERLLAEVRGGRRLLIGIDHGFSFTLAYFERYGLADWPALVADFVRHWPTDEDEVSVDFVRHGAAERRGGPHANARVGNTSWFRLCEQWTSSAKSVFQFDVQGSVAKSTHAGIPWIKWLREQADGLVHVWPFDGWEPPAGKLVVAEVYPSIVRRRYARDQRTADEHDGYGVAMWMADMAGRGVLGGYFSPPLTPVEMEVASCEGWILGVR